MNSLTSNLLPTYSLPMYKNQPPVGVLLIIMSIDSWNEYRGKRSPERERVELPTRLIGHQLGAVNHPCC